MDGSLHTAGIAKHGGVIKLHITLGLEPNADPVSASTQKPELCISTNAKVNLGFGGSSYVREACEGAWQEYV